jgi:transcriptional regulator with XRE-family HTH domain
VKARRAQGAYTTDIARELNLSRSTVSQWVNSESLPPDNRGRFKRKCLYEAIRQPWSNGATEGHVNRLKFLKRQMYGRANFDLLRLKVLLA